MIQKHKKYHFKFTRSHTNIMKHEPVFFTQMDQTKPQKDRVPLVRLQDRNIKLGWKSVVHIIVYHCTDT